MSKRLKLIACEILYRECCAAVARSVNRVDLEFLSKGLHDLGSPGMNDRIAARLADVDEAAYDAVVLGYALCSNGLVGLAARNIPLVVPRAHDCITLFLGSKERYLEYFRSHPGAYFKSSGWIERGDDLEQLSSESVQRRSRMAQSYDEMVARYGEDNARFLYEELRQMTRNYSRIAYIGMGIEPDDRFERETRDLAAARGWQFDSLAGDMSLIQRLVDGPWDDANFLTVPPGHRIAASFDDAIVRAEPDE